MQKETSVLPMITIKQGKGTVVTFCEVSLFLLSSFFLFLSSMNYRSLSSGSLLRGKAAYYYQKG